MSEANKELVRRHFEEIWNRKDLAVADELMAQDYVEHAVAPFGQAEPGRVNGPAAMRETAQWLLAQFPDLHMTVEAIVAEGDTVAVRILSEGTNLGPLNGVMPPTGKQFSARQSHWFRVEDGKLAEHWRPVRTSRRCCNWEFCSLQVGHLPRTLHGLGARDGQALALQTSTPPLAAPPRTGRKSIPRVSRLRNAAGPERYGRPPARRDRLGRRRARPPGREEGPPLKRAWAGLMGCAARDSNPEPLP
jgi:predicted ester cyclase